MIVISCFKPVFSISEIKEGFHHSLDQEDNNMAYDRFCDVMEGALYGIKVNQPIQVNSYLEVACLAVAAKLKLQCYFRKEKSDLCDELESE